MSRWCPAGIPFGSTIGAFDESAAVTPSYQLPTWSIFDGSEFIGHADSAIEMLCATGAHSCTS